MSTVKDRDEIDLNAVLADRVRKQQVIWVTGKLDEAQAKMHAHTVNRLMEETGLPVVVFHSPR